MRRTFEALGDDPADDALHASRIAVKRARYAADLAAHELGRPGARFVAAAKQPAGHPRRPPGRRRRRGTDPGLGRLRRPREGSRPAGSSSSSATGWSPRGQPGPRRGVGSTTPRGGPSAERSFGPRVASSSGAPAASVRCSSSTGRRTTTGASRRGRSSPGRATRTAPCARSRRRPGSCARSGASSRRRTYVDGEGPAQEGALLADGRSSAARFASTSRSTRRAGCR